MLRFRVQSSFLQKYETKQVGCRAHREYWIPAEELPELNANIVGVIEELAHFTPD